FLYRCTTGMIDPRAFGCIMADEMGLGKTLQCIALMWTLLKQSSSAGRGTIEKCIIVCPSSLVRNWGNELVKWLGVGAINPLLVDGKGGKAELIPAVRRWVAARGRGVTLPVMVVSYETLRTLQEELEGCPVGLLLCDEGHRLKNSDSQTFQALNALNVQRRVILSGTPIQNDLSEYFSLLNFANPEYLGTRLDFRKNFELKILRGRDADATEKERKESDEKLKELGGQVSKFIIRRTNDLLSKYLPVKYEHVVFCNLSPVQTALYQLFITSPEIQKLLRGVGSQPLKAINILQKLCNHPSLLNLPDDLPGCEKVLPVDFQYGKGGSSRYVDCSLSGKFVVLERFLDYINRHTNDKIVLISNYTQTLDLFERLCRNKKYGCLRLDGTMNVNKRQKLVDRFNDPEGKETIFLLSSKAGGCGINLIGANRLILFDPAWNPASDQQALARVWRDGQKKECFVYRFQATGTIEEKIFQRQCSKQDLSACVVDAAEDTERHFSGDDLRQLFKFNEKTVCDTHDTFKCKRCRDGKQVIKAPALLYGDASSWNHYPNSELKKLHDDILRAEMDQPEVSFVFQYISH
ncbi:DNA repair protein rhp54, partial [Naganishia adeliensis]